MSSTSAATSGGAAKSSGKPAAKQSSSSSNDNAAHNVRRAFRSFESSVIVAVRQAEKVASSSTKERSSSSGDTAAKSQMDESIELMIKHKQSVRRTATLLEGKIRGNVKESEALHCTLRSQPCVVGGRKRKFSILNTANEGGEPKTT